MDIKLKERKIEQFRCRTPFGPIYKKTFDFFDSLHK